MSAEILDFPSGRRTPPPDFTPRLGDRVVYRGKLAEFHGFVCEITTLHTKHFQVAFPDGTYGVVMDRPPVREFELPEEHQ